MNWYQKDLKLKKGFYVHNLSIRYATGYRIRKKTGYRIVPGYPFHLQKVYCQGSSTRVQRLLFLPSYLFKFTKYVLAILLAPLSLLVRLLARYFYTALYVSVELEAHVSVLNTSGAGADRAAEVLTYLTLTAKRFLHVHAAAAVLSGGRRLSRCLQRQI